MNFLFALGSKVKIARRKWAAAGRGIIICRIRGWRVCKSELGNPAIQDECSITIQRVRASKVVELVTLEESGVSSIGVCDQSDHAVTKKVRIGSDQQGGVCIAINGNQGI
jgi:hypothetical protein